MFPIHRKLMNHGTGGRTSGIWEFDEFMFDENLFGRAAVEYTAIFSDDFDDDFTCFGRHVSKLEVFDDDGNSLPISPASRPQLEAMVLEAFENDKDHVEEFEMGLL